MLSQEKRELLLYILIDAVRAGSLFRLVADWHGRKDRVVWTRKILRRSATENPEPHLEVIQGHTFWQKSLSLNHLYAVIGYFCSVLPPFRRHYSFWGLNTHFHTPLLYSTRYLGMYLMDYIDHVGADESKDTSVTMRVIIFELTLYERSASTC